MPLPLPVLIFLFVFLPAAIIAVVFLGRKKPEQGPGKPTTFGEAAFLTLEDCRDLGLLDGKGQGIPLGFFLELKPPRQEGEKPDYVFHPLHYQGDKHLVTIAPTRTGKGTTAQIPTLLEYDASLFMIDPKGENAVITARCRRDVLGHDVFIVNPFGVLQERFKALGFKSASFNPLAALDPASDTFMAEVAALGEALVVEQSHDPHWPDSARDLITARIMYLCKYGKPEEKNLPAVRDFLTLEKAPKPDDEKAGAKNYFSSAIDLMAACADPEIRNRAMRFFNVDWQKDELRELDSIISTAQTQTAFLDDPRLRESLSGNDFRFIDLKRRKMSVFLVVPAKLIGAYQKWFRLFVVSALNALMSSEEKGEKSVLLMLDEFASLGYLSSVTNAMGMAAGFGLQLWPFVQDIHQLESIYDKRWKSFLSNAGVQQYFTPNDWDTAAHIETRAGKTTVFLQSVSLSEITRAQAEGGFTGKGYNITEAAKPLLEAHKVLGLKPHQEIVFLSGAENTLSCFRKNYWENEDYQTPEKRWDDNPYFVKKTPVPQMIGSPVQGL